VKTSAVIVTYQHARYIAEAVGSALAQSLPPEQVVVVDDGSTDGTPEIVRSIGDRRVELIERDHAGLGGLSATYNVGLERSVGDFIGILEGDDRWPRDRLERQAALIESDTVVAHGLYAVIGAHGTTLHAGVAPSRPIPRGRYDALPHHLLSSYIMAVTALIRREALESIGGFRQLPGTLHWDHPTLLALAERGPFLFMPIVLGEWRRHRRSAVYRLAGQDLRGVDLSLALALETRQRHLDRGVPSVSEVRRSWDEAYAEMVWQNARILLIEHRFAEARALLGTGFGRRASILQRMRALLAMAGAVTHRDVEGVVRSIKRGTPFGQLD
jgi:glycosyltransferase involved in cell wall biosynthesis